ncbi:MAG: DNA polymerase III subunit beta [Paramuribaculum sp.]|nr:DNA polymerase III subunit beta [Paramuribaculum sp.]
MKFNVPSKTLHSYVSAVSKVINSKNALTILNNFLFTLDGDILTVKASDMENSLVGRLPVTGAEGGGSFCLDARRIVDLLKEMPDQGITFEIDDDNLEVKISYPNGMYNTVAINGVEYPLTTEAQEGETISFTMPADQVMKGIENTIFAVGTDELRPQMMGILWDVKPDRIIFVATDTRKLVKYTNSLIKPGSECSFILPLKPATVLKNVFGKEDEIEITVSEKSVKFNSPSFTFDCRQIKGAFPPYDKVIPANNPYALTVDRLSFLTAVRRVGVFGDCGNGLVKFKLTPDTLTLRARDNSYGTSGWESVPCSYTGNEFMIGFGAPYLIEIFSTISTTDVIMKLSDASHPAVCVPAENEPDSELLILLMPMNIVD